MKTIDHNLSKWLRGTTKYAQLENYLIEWVIKLLVNKTIPPNKCTFVACGSCKSQ